MGGFNALLVAGVLESSWIHLFPSLLFVLNLLLCFEKNPGYVFFIHKKNPVVIRIG